MLSYNQLNQGFQLLRFALRVLLREVRAGEHGVLAGALAIAVGSISAVGMFTDRLDQGMTHQAAELLGADLVVSASAPIAEGHAILAHRIGLTTARTLTMRSVVVQDDAFQLVEAKAVTAHYPLRGRVRLTREVFGEETFATAVPTLGTAWVDPRLASALGLTIGSKVTLGRAELTISAFVSYEPDRTGDVFSIAPRILFNLTDVPSTGLIQPGSRVKHRLLVGGQADAVRQFRSTLLDQLSPGEELQGVEDARPEMRMALERARQFLGLAALAAVLLAGVSIALSAHRYARRHQDTAGLLRCFGASRRTVVGVFAVQLLVLGIGAGLLGVGLGFAAQAVLAELLSTLFLGGLPAASGAAALLGLGFGLVTLIGFGLPPLVKLGRIPPARVLRRDDVGASAGNTVTYVAAVLTAAALVLWFAADLELAVHVLGAAAAGAVVLGVCALVLVRLLQSFRNQVGVAWRFGLANIARRGRASTVQVVSFGVGLMALLLLALVRSDLIDAWQQNLPHDTPNYFLINVQPHEARTVRAFLSENGILEAATHPMIRGRLTQIGALPVLARDYPEGRARRLASREFNLSYTRELPKGNAIAVGAWWQPPEADKPQFSVESGIAQTLGIELGDELTFQVAGTSVKGLVSSLRTVKWESFQVNFFVIGTPRLLKSQPATYISSFYLHPERREILTDLLRQHPSVTVIDVDALLTKIRLLMDQAARGVEFVFLFTLLAGLTVLLATVRSTLDERRFESALIRTLGASRARVWHGLAAEFLILGLLAGVLAAAGASLTGVLLATQVFDLPYHGNVWLWVVGIPAGAISIGLTGIIGTRQVVAHPPAATLRDTAL